MAVRDGGQYAKEALDSVLGQSFQDFEFIVINDGSTDNTAEILEHYARLDTRLVVVHQENRGLTAALNTGCRLARGKYIARMDADDITVRERFRTQVHFLDRHSAVAVLGGAIKVIDPRGMSIGEWRYPVDDQQIKEMLHRTNCLCHPAVMMRKDAFDAAKGYRKPFLHAEDYDLWLRMAERFEFANLPDVLLYYRIHAHQVSPRNLRQQVFSALAAEAAARFRRNTGHEPSLPADAVNSDTLVNLGVSRDCLTEALITRHLSWAGQMREIGEYGLAEKLLHEALVLSHTEVTRGWLADIHVEFARCHYLRRQPQCAVISLAKAAVLRPNLAPSFIRFAWLAFRRLGSPSSKRDV